MESAPTPSWQDHLSQLAQCRLCPGVMGPPVTNIPPGPFPPGAPHGAIYLYGQAPGPVEQAQGRPFSGPAGRTLFRWLASIGVEEARFRQKVYMASLIRCFPGKLASGQGDRRPSRDEMAACQSHFHHEMALLAPRLLIPVGGMAIQRLLGPRTLEETVGQTLPLRLDGLETEAIPLPHPSGLSRWTQSEPGRSLLALALARLKDHPVWRQTFCP